MLALRSRVQEEEIIKVARYLNGLKWSIHDALSLFRLMSLQSYFQMARKEEEKLSKKGDSNSKNKGRGKDFIGGSRGGSSGKSNEQRNNEDSKWSE